MVLFDSDSFVKRRTAAGMPEAEAEVLADEHARLIDERLATKSDVVALAAKLEIFATKTDVAALAAKMDTFASKDELKAAIAEAKTDIIKWMFGTIGFQTVLMLGAIVALAKAFH